VRPRNYRDVIEKKTILPMAEFEPRSSIPQPLNIAGYLGSQFSLGHRCVKELVNKVETSARDNLTTICEPTV
jgi:hypothetical protein